MKVYRISKTKYAEDLTGIGAKQFGGRWNMIGIPMLYTSCTISLAVLEILVHLPKHLIPKDLALVTIELDDQQPNTTIDYQDLPKNWRQYPVPYAIQKIGSTLVTDNQLLYQKVPSSIIKSEFNIILNPLFSTFKDLKIINIEPLSLDIRLFAI